LPEQYNMTHLDERVMDAFFKLYDLARIEAGNEVVVLADTYTDRELIEAVSYVGRRNGAYTTVLVGQFSDVWMDRPFRRRPEVSPAWNMALRSSDCVIDISPSRFVYAFGDWNDYRTNQVMLLTPTAEFMRSEAAHFPWQLNQLLGQKVHDVFKSAHMKTDGGHLSDPFGTDLLFTPDYNTLIPITNGPYMDFSKTGAYTMFPATPAITMYANRAHGTIAWQFNEFFHKLLEPPLILNVKDYGAPADIHGANPEQRYGGWVESITQAGDGKDATFFNKVIERHKPNALHVCEFGLGLNPKLPAPEYVDFNTWQTGHKAGYCFTTIGDSWGLGGRFKSAFWENHGLHAKATLEVDGFKLIDEGYLTILSDPEVREEASKYGDPDKLLRDPVLYRNWEF